MQRDQVRQNVSLGGLAFDGLKQDPWSMSARIQEIWRTCSGDLQLNYDERVLQHSAALELNEIWSRVHD